METTHDKIRTILKTNNTERYAFRILGKRLINKAIYKGVDEEDITTMKDTRWDYTNRIRLLLASAVTEEVIFGSYAINEDSEIYTEIAEAISIAKDMIVKFGMSDLGFAGRILENNDVILYQQVNNIIEAETHYLKREIVSNIAELMLAFKDFSKDCFEEEKVDFDFLNKYFEIEKTK